MTYGITIITVCWAALTIFAAPAVGEGLEIAVSEYKVLVNPDNDQERNILLYFELPDALEGADVHSAELLIKPSYSSMSRRYADIMVYPLADEVSIETASWVSVLNDPDETLDTDYGIHEFFNPKKGSLPRIDLTYWLTKCIDSSTVNNGVLLRSEVSDDEGMNLLTDTAFPAGAVGLVRIFYTKKK